MLTLGVRGRLVVQGLMQGNLSQAKMLKAHPGSCTIRISQQMALAVPNTSRFRDNFTKSSLRHTQSHHTFLYSCRHDFLPQKFNT